ncbi:MAG: hypothetical protein ABIO44_03475 [Saprospiraceae bacterium]
MFQLNDPINLKYPNNPGSDKGEDFEQGYSKQINNKNAYKHEIGM